MTIALQISPDLLYPQSDGNPMAESTEQYDWIVFIKENIESLFADREDVFVAADLLWYPVQVELPPAPCQAPDTMVVFGRPKGMRRSYLQWNEDNLGPQVVFEILSASNKTRKGVQAMESKFSFYERYGIEEYYIYDPEKFQLVGYQRRGERLVEIPNLNGWVSPRLQVRFEWQPGMKLNLYRPDGIAFVSFRDLQQQTNAALQKMQQADQRAEQAEQTLQSAVPRFLSLGLTVEQIAIALGTSTEEINKMIASKSQT